MAQHSAVNSPGDIKEARQALFHVIVVQMVHAASWIQTEGSKLVILSLLHQVDSQPSASVQSELAVCSCQTACESLCDHLSNTQSWARGRVILFHRGMYVTLLLRKVNVVYQVLPVKTWQWDADKLSDAGSVFCLCISC